MNPRGDLRIIDFDLAVQRGKKPVRMREISGTPAYIAPEVLAKSKVDEQTDIFSFGVIGFEILTGRKPPAAAMGPNPRRSLKIEADLQDSGAPRGLQRIISKCLDPDPSARYPAMALAVDELKNIT